MLPMTPPDPTGIFPLPAQTLILVEGEDRLRFLNGQVTNDVRLATPDSSLYAAVLNAKGKLEAICHIRAVQDGFLLDAPPSLREALPARLDRYLIADDVTLTDVSDRWSSYHVLGTKVDEAQIALPAGTIKHPANRFGVSGWDLFTPTPLSFPDDLLLTAETVDALRIRQGVPLWPSELSPGLLPPEAGLDQSAISYEKGCYLGQEVISRIKRAGKINRHLVQLEVPLGTQPGPILNDGAIAGEITSISPSSSDSPTLALGFRKRVHEETVDFTLSEGGHAHVVQRLA